MSEPGPERLDDRQVRPNGSGVESDVIRNMRSSAEQDESRAGPVDLLCAGFVTLDILRMGQRLEHHAGGTACNVAANVAWLGRSTAILGRIGADVSGRLLREDLSRMGVNTDELDLVDLVSTPQVMHEVSRGGSHRYLFSCPECGKAFPRHRPAVVSAVVRAGARLRPKVLFFDRASAGTVAAAAAAVERGALVFFEPSTAGRIDLTRRAMAMADIVKVSADRLPSGRGLPSPSSPRQIQIVTHAGAGLSWRRGPSQWQTLSAFPAQAVVDSGGAGDWTTAGLLVGLLAFANRSLGGSVLTSARVIRAGLRFGQALASLSLAHPGARGLAVRERREDVLRRAGAFASVPKGRGEGPPPAWVFRGPISGCEVCLRSSNGAI